MPDVTLQWDSLPDDSVALYTRVYERTTVLGVDIYTFIAQVDWDVLEVTFSAMSGVHYYVLRTATDEAESENSDEILWTNADVESDFIAEVVMAKTQVSGVLNPGAAPDIYPVICPIPDDTAMPVATLSLVVPPESEIT